MRQCVSTHQHTKKPINSTPEHKLQETIFFSTRLILITFCIITPFHLHYSSISNQLCGALIITVRKTSMPFFLFLGDLSNTNDFRNRERIWYVLIQTDIFRNITHRKYMHDVLKHKLIYRLIRTSPKISKILFFPT